MSAPERDPALRRLYPVAGETGPPKSWCKHGNRRDLGICSECDAERMRKRQRSADRARFREQLRRIRGEVT